MREMEPTLLEFVCGGASGEFRTVAYHEIPLSEEPPGQLIREAERFAGEASRREPVPIPLRWLPPGNDRERVY